MQQCKMGYQIEENYKPPERCHNDGKYDIPDCRSCHYYEEGITDYEEWKQWLDKWNIKYEEEIWNPDQKELIIGGSFCQASIVFNLKNEFICMTAYE